MDIPSNLFRTGTTGSVICIELEVYRTVPLLDCNTFCLPLLVMKVENISFSSLLCTTQLNPLHTRNAITSGHTIFCNSLYLLLHAYSWQVGCTAIVSQTSFWLAAATTSLEFLVNSIMIFPTLPNITGSLKTDIMCKQPGIVFLKRYPLECSVWMF